MDPQPTYVLHLEADLNRVFTDAVADLAATELRIAADRRLADAVGPIETATFGRTRLLRFPCSAPVDDLAALVGQLSASAALFREHRPTGTDPGDPPLLEPIPIEERLAHGTELATTQRYRGKTNERLTRAMLNLALATAGLDPARPTGTILDPMCGRGTTLNWALSYGLDSVGIEIDRASLDQHRIFLETWAKRQRLPHKATRHRDGNAERRWLSLRVAVDRAAQKAGDDRTVETFHADGADPDLPLRRGSIDAIVTDLPYGVQHRGSGRGSGSAGADDHADTGELLTRVLPQWHRWLRPGGALCLAWNLKQADRSTVSATLARADFDPVVARGGFTMRHIVDASIDRDVIVAHRR